MDTAIKDMLETQRPGECIPLSQRIRERLQQAGARFHANDNIAPFLQDGEMELLQHEVAGKLQAVLRALVIDVDNDHNTRDTAARVAKMFVQEVFAGRYQKAPAATEFPNCERLNELLIVGPLRVRSACSHHLCPIMGRIWIGVMPSKSSNLIGLSKYGRLVQWIMSRPQIQEEAVMQTADILESKLRPDGLAVVLEADHYCMHWRGIKDASLRREFLALVTNRSMT